MDFLATPEAQMILGMTILFTLMLWGGSNSKRRLTIASWASPDVIAKGTQVGIHQLRNPQVKSVCLVIGKFQLPSFERTPDWQRPFLNWGFSFFISLQILITKSPPAILVPTCNPLIEVVGKSGSGKTFSVINPMLLSAIKQGHPIVLYDAKADERGADGQTPFILTYAKSQGYDVKVFSPGRPFSCTINPLDFMRDCNDKAMASVIAKTFQENLRGNGDKKDGFFGPAGERLMTALLQYAKFTQEWAISTQNHKNATDLEKQMASGIAHYQTADLATAFKFLGLSDFPKRLATAKENSSPYLPYWVRQPFQQIISVKDAAPTSGGIIGQANDLLEELQQPHFLPSYTGKTNVNLMLGRKQLLVFQSDRQRRNVVNPLIAAIMTILVNLNFATKRDCPLILSIDEFPTLTLNEVPNWANELRSKGLVLILGYQEFNQLEKAYGRENSEIIRGPANHRFWFNPGTQKTAKELSDFLGQTETIVKNKSRSRNFGMNGGGSQSTSEQVMQLPLMSADEINSMIQGECIYIGTEYRETLTDPRDKKRKSRIRPWHLTKIPLPKSYFSLEKQCESLYDKKVYPWLCQQAQKRQYKSSINLNKSSRQTQSDDPTISLQAAMSFREDLANFFLPKVSQEESSNNPIPDLNDLF
ncbi:type IV secretory system conjugative DNA transfer family protein [Crocosphaera chwakensis]|uniref:TraD/TraG TraM recognition site domain-containing protein n=1 Tax=Crocosphaera chwakensis CCY0110 TaxID=391612 RepID=A3IZA3_9CHRO|nr:TraM recognition domain-containing protein [Crocosphaera chwakensis]EAZ88194.1 hypothetical protein CY0110_14675 [Crocosphaera chwakensis CCY0110]